MSSNYISDYYNVKNGLQILKDKESKQKSQEAYPWSGNAQGTDPYSDFSDGSRGWLELIDENLREGRKREDLRKHLEQNEPMVMLRANRNAPLKYKWSSVALVDVPEYNIFQKC